MTGFSYVGLNSRCQSSSTVENTNCNKVLARVSLGNLTSSLSSMLRRLISRVGQNAMEKIATILLRRLVPTGIQKDGSSQYFNLSNDLHMSKTVCGENCKELRRVAIRSKPHSRDLTAQVAKLELVKPLPVLRAEFFSHTIIQ